MNDNHLIMSSFQYLHYDVKKEKKVSQEISWQKNDAISTAIFPSYPPSSTNNLDNSQIIPNDRLILKFSHIIPS